MRWCLLLAALCALVGAAHAMCDACLHGNCYEKQLLAEKVDYVTPRIFYKENLLYSYLIIESQCFIRQFNLNTGTYRDVADEWETVAFAVNQNTGDLYLASNNGKVYRLDNNLKFQGSVLNKRVYYIEFKDKLYTSNQRGLDIVENGVSHVVPGTEERIVYDVVIDKNNDVYFQELLANGDYQITKFENVTNNISSFVIGDYKIASDKNGDVIFFNKNTRTIYKKNRDSGELVEFGLFDKSVTNIVLDKDDRIIFYDPDKLYRLKQVQNVECEIKTPSSGNKFILQKYVRVTKTTAANKVSVETSTHSSTELPDSQAKTEQTLKRTLSHGNITVDTKTPTDSKDDGKQDGSQNCTCTSSGLTKITIKIDLCA